jgi:tripartite-type tricarboxylate transporter receptor subunit TctC
MRTGFCVVAAITLCTLSAGVARSDAVSDFYQGKQVRLIIGNPPGGDYDLGGRLLARYMGRYIPGTPTIVVQNMPGASTIVAANYLYNVAPKDGMVFGSFSRNLASQGALGRETLKADPRKYGWIGASSLPARICAARASSPVKSISDLFTQELIVAGSGAGSSLSIVPTTLNRVLGTKFRVVEGYKGAADAIIALERGEVQGICHTFSLFRNTHAELIRDGKIRVLLHAEEATFPDMPEVPSVYAFAKTEEQKQMMRFIFSSVEFGRPYVAPPGVPADRLAALRSAFASAFKDRELLAEATKLKLDVTYRSPDELIGLVEKLYATPSGIIAQAQELMPTAGD